MASHHYQPPLTGEQQRYAALRYSASFMQIGWLQNCEIHVDCPLQPRLSHPHAHMTSVASTRINNKPLLTGEQQRYAALRYSASFMQIGCLQNCAIHVDCPLQPRLSHPHAHMTSVASTRINNKPLLTGEQQRYAALIYSASFMQISCLLNLHVDLPISLQPRLSHPHAHMTSVASTRINNKPLLTDEQQHNGRATCRETFMKMVWLQNFEINVDCPLQPRL